MRNPLSSAPKNQKEIESLEKCTEIGKMHQNWNLTGYRFSTSLAPRRTGFHQKDDAGDADLTLPSSSSSAHCLYHFGDLQIHATLLTIHPQWLSFWSVLETDRCHILVLKSRLRGQIYIGSNDIYMNLCRQRWKIRSVAIK